MIRACAWAPFFQGAVIALAVTAGEALGGAAITGSDRLVAGAAVTFATTLLLSLIGQVRESAARQRGYQEGRAAERDGQGWECRRA